MMVFKNLKNNFVKNLFKIVVQIFPTTSIICSIIFIIG